MIPTAAMLPTGNDANRAATPASAAAARPENAAQPRLASVSIFSRRDQTHVKGNCAYRETPHRGARAILRADQDTLARVGLSRSSPPWRAVVPARSTSAFKVQRPFVYSHRETGVRPLPTLRRSGRCVSNAADCRRWCHRATRWQLRATANSLSRAVSDAEPSQRLSATQSICGQKTVSLSVWMRNAATPRNLRNEMNQADNQFRPQRTGSKSTFLDIPGLRSSDGTGAKQAERSDVTRREPWSSPPAISVHLALQFPVAVFH
ncbi:hypothetical protein OKW38_005045 [Paraburkholderia sp. MM5496-R1]